MKSLAVQKCMNDYLSKFAFFYKNYLEKYPVSTLYLNYSGLPIDRANGGIKKRI